MVSRGRCRRRPGTVNADRLDAEIVVGGRLGPCEAVVMRMHGRLALHAESVVMPLLAPDVPVVTWWHGAPPERIANDPLGVVADRRITDVAQAADPVAALRQRAEDYAPGDTDLAWTRITPWRTLRRRRASTPSTPEVTRGDGHRRRRATRRRALLRGWLTGAARHRGHAGRGRRVAGSAVEFALRRRRRAEPAQPRRRRRPLSAARGVPATGSCRWCAAALGDELAEELRRLDADQPYAAALQAATGVDRARRPRPAVRGRTSGSDPAAGERTGTRTAGAA